MLSQDDRRRLDAIEQQLQASDPELAKSLTRWPAPARTRWAMAGALLTAFFGTCGVLLGALALAPALIVMFGSVALVGWIWVYRRARRTARPRVE